MASPRQNSASAMTSFMGVMNSAKQTWDSSGANDIVSRVSDNIPQGTKEYISATSAQVFNRQKLRSVTVVFGMGEERPFYLEKVPSLLVARLRHNVQFFFMNYVLLTALVFALFCTTLLLSPISIIKLALLGGLWVYTMRKTQSGFLQVGSVSISQQNVLIGLSLFTAVMLFLMLTSIFWYSLFSSGFLILAHAVMRDASMHQDGEDQVDMVGEIASGEQDSFLGVSKDGDV
eukprot:Nitzschia sp. Nitz4//scaffold30_size153850//9938//10887//NITZ4_002757-RA/size153850-augustus-gene-0.65-mRNA-1//-1//CDS//3329547199//8127//frame0